METKGKIVGRIRRVVNEKLDLNWNPKAIVDFLREENNLEISSTAIIKYRRKRTKALELHEGKRVLHDFRGPVISEVRKWRHRLQKILEEEEKELASATPTDIDKLRRRIIELYRMELEALKAKDKEEETDITLLFKKEAEREPDESKRDFKGVVLRLLAKDRKKQGFFPLLPEEDFDKPIEEKDNQ